MSDLDKTLALLVQINALIPIVSKIVAAVQKLFADQTINLTNEERIALLRQAGMATQAEAETWLAAHPPTR